MSHTKIWVDEQGRISIPKKLRDIVGIETSSHILCSIDGGSLVFKAANSSGGRSVKKK